MVVSSTRTWKPPPSRTTGEFVPTRVRIEAPLFNGDDPLGWIFGIQDYFNYFVTDESVRLAVVEKIIEQPALDWFHNYQKSDMKGSWEDFLVAVRYHFAPELTEEVDDEEQLGGSSLCAGIPDEVMDVDVVSQKFALELVSDDVPSNVGAPSDGVVFSVASKLVTDSLFVTDPSDETLKLCEFSTHGVDGDDALLAVESSQIDAQYVATPTPSDSDYRKSCLEQQKLLGVGDQNLFRLEQTLTTDGRSIPPRDEPMILGRIPIIKLRVMPPRSTNSSFEMFQNCDTPRTLLDGIWCRVTLQFGADKGIQIFDPGAGAYESDVSGASENSSRLRCHPQFELSSSKTFVLSRSTGRDRYFHYCGPKGDTKVYDNIYWPKLMITFSLGCVGYIVSTIALRGFGDPFMFTKFRAFFSTVYELLLERFFTLRLEDKAIFMGGGVDRDLNTHSGSTKSRATQREGLNSHSRHSCSSQGPTARYRGFTTAGPIIPMQPRRRVEPIPARDVKSPRTTSHQI